MRNTALSSNSSLISNYSTISSDSSLSASSTVALLQGLLDGFGWRDKRLEIYEAEADQQFAEQKLQMAIDHFVEEPDSANNRDRLIQALNEAQISVQEEYNYAIKQRNYYQEQTQIESAQKSATSATSYLSQWSRWAFDGVKSFFGSTMEQLVEKYATMVETRQVMLAQLSGFLEELVVPIKTNVNKLMDTALNTDLSAHASICDAPLGQVELSALTESSGLVINGAAPGDFSGGTVGKAGDINHDGIDDLVIGAQGASPNGKQAAGASYVVFGSLNVGINGVELSKLNGTTGFVINGAKTGDWSGYSVNGAGDINHDGIDDLVVGVPYASPKGNSRAGASCVIFGSQTVGGNGVLELSDLNGLNGFVINGVAVNDYSGNSVSRAGDVNHDGIDDLIIGALGASPHGKKQAGVSYVVFGSPNIGRSGVLDLSSLNLTTGIVINGITSGDQSGYSVSGSLDINQDGISDLVIGGRYASPNNKTNAGTSYVLFGSPNTEGDGVLELSSLNGMTGFLMNGAAAKDLSGSSVSAAGDMNNDGIDDLVIGALGASPNSKTYAGTTYVVFGFPGIGNEKIMELSNLNGTNGFMINGVMSSDNSGWPVSGAGDVNNDGIDDLIVGAQYASSNGKKQAGTSYVIFGSPRVGKSVVLELSSLNGINGFSINGLAAGDRSGRAVSGVGDLNHDGIDDMVIGAPQAAPNGKEGAGKIYVVFGSFSFAINQLTLKQGGSIPLTAHELSLWSTNHSQQIFTPCNVQNGQFELPLINPPGQRILDFTQQQLLEGDVAFVHNGGLAAPYYEIRMPAYGAVISSAVSISFSLITNNSFQARNELSTLTVCEGIAMQGVANDEQSGFSVSGIGDINHDGFDDLLMGAPQASPNSKHWAGAAYVVFGSPSIGKNNVIIKLSNLNGTNGFIINGVAALDRSGRAVSGVDDLNHDGIDDLVIGVPLAKSLAGLSYVIFGSVSVGGNGVLELSSLNGKNGFVINGVMASDSSGISVSGAGDINCDGIDDLILGAPGVSLQTGASYVVFGAKNLGSNGVLDLASLNGTAGFVINGVVAGDNIGSFVSRARDLNGDGIDDLAIGAFNASPNSKAKAGVSYIVFGHPDIGKNGLINLSSLNGTNGFVINGVAAGDYSGTSVSGAGDINYDGIDDLVVGAPWASPNGVNSAGTSYVVFGSPNVGGYGIFELSTLNGTNGFVINSAKAGDISGKSVNGVGDINQDGINDLIIGAPNAQNGVQSAGETYVVFGSSNLGKNGTLVLSNLNGVNGFMINGVATNDQCGFSVSRAKDINSDGIDDLLIGAPSCGNTACNNPGVTYVVFGNSFRLLKNQLPLISGGMVVLLENYLNISVTYCNSEEIVYSVSDVQHGRFELVIIPGSPILSFTQNQITQNQIRFVHDGSTQPPQFNLQITRGFYVINTPGFVHFNARPDFVNNSLPVIQGALNPINSTYLWATDRESPAERLTYVVSNVRYGQFEFSSNPSKPITAFTTPNITNGVLFFRHDGSILPPSYTVSVSDSVNVYATEGIIEFDHLPELVNNQLFVNQGEATVLKSTDLSAKSSDHSASGLYFLVDTVSQGQFNLLDVNGTIIATNVTGFIQQNVTDQRVAFLHDGSTTAPSYRVAVSDGLATIPSQPAVIQFNHAPVLTLYPFPIDQGRATIISPASLSATDVETPSSNLLFKVSNIGYGQFEFTTTPGVALIEFLQLSVQVSSIQFVNNGSDDSPTFAFSVSDGQITTSPQAAVINFNHQPRIKNNSTLMNQTVTASEHFDFTIDLSIFEDPDNQTLTFTAEQADKRPLVNTINFDNRTGRFSGVVDTLSPLAIAVTAHDPRDLTVTTDFGVTVLPPPPSSLLLQVLTPTAFLSVLTALMGYSYRRYRMWNHRQQNTFAEHLRVALNLDIYDFSNEEGNDYIRKVDNFIQHVNAGHQQFYKHLAPDQVKVFAGYVAETIREHEGMLKPATCWTRFFSAATCYGRRWVNQLNVTAFGYEIESMAQHAVTAYQGDHGNFQEQFLSFEIESGSLVPPDSTPSVSLNSSLTDRDVKSENKEPLLPFSRSAVFSTGRSTDRVSLLEKNVADQNRRLKELEKQAQETKQSRSSSPRVSGASLFPLVKTGTVSAQTTSSATSTIPSTRSSMSITSPPPRGSATPALKRCLVM